MKEKLKNITSTIEIKNFIKYCQGYIKLVNPSFNRFRINTDPIDKKYLSPDILYNDYGEEDSFEFNFPEFYEFNPKNIPEGSKEEYEKQKELAQQLEQLKNRFKISEFTKQTNLNFGYFKVEIPESAVDEFSEDEEEKEIKKKKDDIYPLFSLPIEIIAERKFFVKLQDVNIIPNIGFLYDVLGEEKFYEFADYVNRQEIDGNLKLPIKKGTIENIWQELKSKLKLSDASFDEDSFNADFFIASLSGKSNYFLQQDFNELTQLEEEDFTDSSLSSWNSDEELNIDEPVNEKDGELFFPFPYNRDQLGVLSAIKNKASIVEGPPGTGKSLTIANLLCHLAANHKKVLFLSQKAQAIKVVKDYLKKLNVDYLYGYVPNRFSSLYNAEEEKDSASNSLQSIHQHLNSLGYEKKEFERVDPTKEKFEVQEQISNSVCIQRKIYETYQKKEELEDFNIEAKDLQLFNEATNEDVIAVLEKDKDLTELLDKLDKYSSEKSKIISQYDKTFTNIEVNNNGYVLSCENIIKAIPIGAFEREGLFNSIKEQIIKQRLKKHTEQFPKEIFDVYNELINKKNSRSEKIKELTELKDYFSFKEDSLLYEVKKEEFSNDLTKLGLDEKSFSKLRKLLSSEKGNLEKIRLYITTVLAIDEFKTKNPNELKEYLHKICFEENKYISMYLRNLINFNLKEITKNTTIKGLIAQIARSLQKSKKAYKTFDRFKNEPTNFYVMREAVPIWIMDLDDVSRLIPLEKNLFDYVILDEASQCNVAYALPAMFRARKAVFVGDSEQMRDDTVRFKTNKSLEVLAKKFNVPEFLQIKSIGDSVQSIMDIGYKRGFMMKPLTYHYRSPKELIGFSNDSFYAPKGKRLKVINTNYLTYKDTNRVLINHIIKPTKELDISSKSNIAEAKYICNLIDDLKKDPKTKDKSIGVLSFFGNQATLLREMIKDESIKVSIIEGIQGDEKDIIIYSLVICDPGQKRMYIPLTGEGGEINKALNEGRVNVAFSRAKQQVHCVTSLPVEKWSEGIWVKKYLEYVQKNGEVDFFNVKLKPFDSKFEEDFCDEILKANFKKGFIIQNQVESCGFKIDFALTDVATGKQLAIECDGPTHFVDEGPGAEYVDSDFDRQAVLESAGWTFYRVNYADWANKEFDKGIFTKDIEGYFENNIPMMVEENKDTKEMKGNGDKIVVVDIDKIETPLVSKQKEAKQGPITTDNTSKESGVSNSQAQFHFKEKSFQKDKVSKDFNNILTFPIGGSRKLVASLFNENEDLIITEYVNTDSYKGYTPKNVIVAVKDINIFIEKSQKVLSSSLEESVPWKGSESEKIIIKKIDSSTIDIRQYLNTSWYTGYTKKGFRLDSSTWNKFIELLGKATQSL